MIVHEYEIFEVDYEHKKLRNKMKQKNTTIKPAIAS